MINCWDEHCTSPGFLLRACLNISMKSLVVASSRNGNASATNERKFFHCWNEVFFDFNDCSYINVFWFMSYQSNFFVCYHNILMWTLKEDRCIFGSFWCCFRTSSPASIRISSNALELPLFMEVNVVSSLCPLMVISCLQAINNRHHDCHIFSSLHCIFQLKTNYTQENIFHRSLGNSTKGHIFQAIFSWSV